VVRIGALVECGEILEVGVLGWCIVDRVQPALGPLDCGMSSAADAVAGTPARRTENAPGETGVR